MILQPETRRSRFPRICVMILLGLLPMAIFAHQIHAKEEGAQAATTWIVIRHAERAGNADQLTDAGNRRAELLKQLGTAIRTTAIYSTDYQRTRETVTPLAEKTDVAIQIYSPGKLDWLQQAQSEHVGGVIVIVGHSNTTLPIVEALSGYQAKPIGHDEYDRLFLLQTGTAEPTCLELRYGESSAGAPSADAALMTPVKPPQGDSRKDRDVGAQPPAGATMLLDGSRELLDKNWTYWEGPRFSSQLPIKWKVVPDPVNDGTAVMTFDPAAAGGVYGAADIVTKETFRDFHLHVEFLIQKPGGNSGVYLQNRYEIQILDGDKTSHGMAAVINEKAANYEPYRGVGKWNAYDIDFQAARFENGKRTEKAKVTLYFNGTKVHDQVPITRVWGGPNSGIDGDNDQEGNGIKDTPGGLKLQAEGHEVLYRNIWIENRSKSTKE